MFLKPIEKDRALQAVEKELGNCGQKALSTDLGEKFFILTIKTTLY